MATDASDGTRPFSGKTAWARNLETPLREFIGTETGSAGVLLAATIAALLWINVDSSSYRSVWETDLAVRLGDHSINLDLRGWLNSGLMTLFFFVVGLEARREFDMGELRQRRRVALPVLAGIGGMVVPVLIYLAFNAGSSTAHGWGTAMSTDTAFALGLLALVGPRFPDRLRVFLLTVAIIDDVIALTVIALVYSGHIVVGPLLVALAVLTLVLVMRSLGVRYGLPYALLGVAAWLAVESSGIDPIVVGLVLGLLVYASPAARGDLERATDLFRAFREQPTPELARTAQSGVRTAISPNVRLQGVFHPWTSYVIVPLFALANAGIEINGPFLSRAFTSTVTLGILIGYVVGKPIGVAGTAWLVTVFSRGRLRPPVGWAAVVGGGAIAGIGFTVSILIATLAFSGDRLEEAKLGVLSAAVVSSLFAWVLFRATARLPLGLRVQALLGSSEAIVDLAAPVDDERDHIRGPADAPVTVVEYGDFECPYCGQAEAVMRDLLADHGDVRYVWRHLPLNDVHPNAQLAAEAAEAAGDQGSFWEMHDLLLSNQGAQRPGDLVGYAEQLGLDVDRFRDHMRRGAGVERIDQDVDSADMSGVSGTPTFFINGRRHNGAYDLPTLSAEVRVARARTLVAPAR
ncbi:MAG: Na+/H+ antiporter NhaA [Gaiellales bacterium]